jgi:hypothetical protein
MTIRDVKAIYIMPMEADERVPVYQQNIIVRTVRGEEFEIVLQAPKKQNLKLRKKRSYWREPLIYIPEEDIPY